MDQIQKTMALAYDKNIFGFAIYDNSRKEFTITPDTLDTNECDTLKSLLYKFDIENIIVSLDLDNIKYESLAQTSIKAVIVDRATFTLSRKLKIDKIGHKISSRCFNALLIYLEKNHTEFAGIMDQSYKQSHYKGVSSNIVRLGYISFYPLLLFQNNKYMYVNVETVSALSLFKTVHHPNIHIKAKGEDGSLYKILNNTCTAAGGSLLKNWICFPLIDRIEIEKRRCRVESILSKNLVKMISEHLKKCKPYSLNCPLYRTNIVKLEFYKLHLFLSNARQLLCIFTNTIDIKIVNRILEIIECNIELSNGVENIIKANVDADLDKLNDTYTNLSSYLNEAAIKCAAELEIKLVIVYFPQLGYLIETSQEVPTLEPVFTGDKKQYYKNKFMHLLDQEIGDLYNKIKDAESTILHRLVEEINSYDSEMLALSDFVAELDCYNSLAIAAEKHNMIKPTILDTKGEIHIKNYRNVISAKIMKAYTVKDIDANGCKVITGRNCSGKSTYLKDIGTAVIMNQIGSYIPCISASLSLFDKLFPKIISTESLELKRSAFISDVIQCSNIFRLGSESSLALIDEFGKGTSIPDGCSLFLSAVKNLEFMTAIFVTHFSNYIDVKDYKDTQFIYMDNMIAHKGIYLSKDNVNSAIKNAFANDTRYAEYLKINEKVKNNDIENVEKDNKWAVKIVNDFIRSGK